MLDLISIDVARGCTVVALFSILEKSGRIGLLVEKDANCILVLELIYCVFNCNNISLFCKKEWPHFGTYSLVFKDVTLPCLCVDGDQILIWKVGVIHNHLQRCQLEDIHM